MNESEFTKRFNDLVEEYVQSQDFEEIFEGYNMKIGNGEEYCVSLNIFYAKGGEE